MQPYRPFIDGRFSADASHDPIEVINPATEEVWAGAQPCSGDETLAAIAAAKAAQPGWARLPAVTRAAYLKKITVLLRENAPALGRTITLEQGKPLAIATGEATWGADLMEYHAEWARRIEGDIIPSDTSHENIMLYREPIGVVACILPWNFPLYVLIRKLAPALITGNTVVIKPSCETPCSASAFAELLPQAKLPPGVVNIVIGRGATVGNALCTSADVGLVTLTGSTAAGRQVMQSCAANITKVSLELGGKAPAIVMDDADIDLAVASILGGRIANAGQVCNCVERVYLQQGIAATFIERMHQAMQQVTIGSGLDNPDMGPLISGSARDTVHAMVQQAVADGAVLVAGGKICDRFNRGYFYEPTLLVGCRQEMAIMREEIFGPVMPVMTFASIDEALTLANDSQYGLTATLYTTNYATALRFANEIECGELYINRQQGEAYQGFHAGWKHSGIGGDDGKHGMQTYLRNRIVYMRYG
jgi:lactaldehyde dehydrogenase/glycolaldehyde dehydrogenase